MFVYFNKEGVIKEIINDSSIRQGNANVNTVYFFIEGADPQTTTDDLGMYYKALFFSLGRYTMYLLDEHGEPLPSIEGVSFDITTVKMEVPYDKKKELKFFKYFTRYEMFQLPIPQEVLNYKGTVGLKFQMVNNDAIDTQGLVVFNIEGTSPDLEIAPDTAITIAEWNYLLANMLTPGDVYTKAEANSTFQEKLTAGENITIDENNVISATGGGGGGITVPTFDAYFEGELEFEDFQLAQEDLNDIWENKYPLINIRVTIEEEGQTIYYVICFKLSHNVAGMAMTYAMTSMEFSDDEGHQNDLDCMAFIITLDEETDLPTIVAVNEEYYTNDYRNLENKPFIPEIDTTIGPESLDDKVPSSKCVYDNLVNVREVAEGKCQTFVLSYTDTLVLVKNDVQQDANKRIFNGSGTDITDAVLNGDYDNQTFGNANFNSQADQIYCFQSPYSSYLIVRVNGGYMFLSYTDVYNRKKGDIYLVIQTNVPDRWYGDEYTFYKLETAKVDLTNYVTLDGTQTITGEKTFRDLALSASSSYDTNKWYIRGWGASGLDIGLRGENKGIKIQEDSVSPLTTAATDLGSTSSSWKRLFLSNNQDGACFLTTINTYYNLYTDTNNNLNLALPSGTVAERIDLDGNFISMNGKDLGDSSHKWQDLYLSGKASFSYTGGSDWTIERDNAYNLSFYYGGSIKYSFQEGQVLPRGSNQNLGSGSFFWNHLYLSRNINFDNTNNINWITVGGDNCCYFKPYILVVYNIEPLVNASTVADYNIGSPNKRFGTVHSIDMNISGNISDGTNSVSVADLAALIAYAKAQGWIS